MVEYKEKTITTNVPDKYICDRCKKEMPDYSDPVKIRHDFGYGTEHDGECWEFELCEKCLIDIISLNKIQYRKFDQWNCLKIM